RVGSQQAERDDRQKDVHALHERPLYEPALGVVVWAKLFRLRCSARERGRKFLVVAARECNQYYSASAARTQPAMVRDINRGSLGDARALCPGTHPAREAAVVAVGIDFDGAAVVAAALGCVVESGVCLASEEMNFGEHGFPHAGADGYSFRYCCL